MTINIYDLFDKKEFDQAIADKHIRVQKHPEHDLFVANYTDKVMYDRAWNDATLTCRGLIYDANDVVVARSFKKFFNLGEVDIDVAGLGRPSVYEKQDGSMGTIFPLPGGPYAVATRGSFASDQAIWATAWLQKWMPDFAPPPGTTQIVEIIYPENRIVVDYGDYEGLVALAVIDNKTGLTLFEASPGWTWDVVERFDIGLNEVLAIEGRQNREGFVLHFPGHDVRVKVKHAEYVKLHAVMTGATELAVWRFLAESDTNLMGLIDDAPVELRDWVDGHRAAMEAKVAGIIDGWRKDYEEILATLPAGLDLEKRDRKEFAMLAVKRSSPSAMFALLDGKDVSKQAWAQIRPDGPGERFSGGWS